MKKASNKYHKSLAALLIIVALSGALIASHLTGLLDYVEYKTYDFRINFNARISGSRFPEDIILVLLDQNSLDWAQQNRGWGWPWPRAAYAEFIDYMSLGGAKSVAFDVIFSEPSIYRNPRQDEIIERTVRTVESSSDPGEAGERSAAERISAAGSSTERNPGERREARTGGSSFRDLIRDIRSLGERVDDATFAEAAKNYGHVVQAALFRSQSGSADSWPAGLNVPLFKPENFGSFLSEFSGGGKKNEVLNGGQFPIQDLRNTAGIIGSVTGIADDVDNIFRRLRLFTLFDGKAVPGLAAASLLVSGEDPVISYDPAKRQMHWGNYTIPVDKEGKTLLRFRSSMERYIWYGMSEVLQSAEDYAAGREPLLYPEDFRDSYVFFGFFAPGLFDVFSTPIDTVYPGMGVHITLLDNLLMGDFIQEAPEWVAIAIIMASIILVVVLVLFLGRIAITVAGLVVSIAAIIGAGFVTFNAGWWIPMAAPLIAVFLSYLSATLYSYATEGKDKRFLKQAFSSVVSPKLVDQLMGDPSQLKLGGERRKMTAIFTDIQRFSSISSELQDSYGEDGPKVLVNLLNLYLTEMSNIIINNGGTVDKYEGDAIIAFFGAPVWMEDHAVRACLSAVQMKKREIEIVSTIMDPETQFSKPLAKLIDENVIRKERPLYTRLGLNTGDMVVGFMGTPGKMDYTIMGNAVNLAARLEGVNKQYDTKGILISQDTRSQIGEEFIVRPLSRVTVVGIPAPIRLYELFELRSEASAEMLEMLEIWNDAFKAWENHKFADAGKLFAEVYRRDPEDRTARLYSKRCEKFVVTPPPEKWNGVDALTEK